MTSRDFCYWLQGVFEVANPKVLDEVQVELIKRHLSLVFLHEIDPSFGKDNAALNAIHSPEKPKPSTSGNNTSASGSPLIRC